MAADKATLSTTGKTQDDPSLLNSEMLRFSSVRVPLALTVGLLPVVASSIMYISTFSVTAQFLLGGAAGVAAMFSFQLFQVHRSAARRLKALQIAQLAELSQSDVKRLLPDEGVFPVWESFGEFDKLEWLNKEMDIMWPFLDKAISATVKEQAQPILNQYAMGLVKKFVLKDLTLGVKAPRFDGIKISAGVADETVLEAKFSWVPQKENLVLKVESTGPDFQVKVKDIQINGTMKIYLKPLIDTLPPFGAVLVSFTEAPFLDFTIKFLGVSNDILPGVDDFIDDSIRTAIMDSMVWPCRIVVPMAPGDWSYLDLRPEGELDVTFIEARDVAKTDVIGKADPFCMFYVRQKADKIKRSSTKKNKTSAEWNESFILEVEDKATQVLTVRLMDDESLEKSQYVGSGDLKISELEPGTGKDVWLDMYENPHGSGNEAPRGRVHLLVVYKPLPDDDPRTAAYAKAHRQDPKPAESTETPAESKETAKEPKDGAAEEEKEAESKEAPTS